MKGNKINPLNVLDIRRVDFCPSYFETITIDQTYNLGQAIDEWIFDNLTGRYYIGKTVEIKESEKNRPITQRIKIGFENSKEMSYFMLACPHLKYR